MLDFARTIGQIEGRVDAQESRIDRIETSSAQQFQIVHGRFDRIEAKQDSMTALLNRWMGGIAVGLGATTIAGGLLTAAIEGHWGPFK